VAHDIWPSCSFSCASRPEPRRLPTPDTPPQRVVVVDCYWHQSIMSVFYMIICLQFPLIFFRTCADECSPTTAYSARLRPAPRPPVAPPDQGAVPAPTDARTYHSTSPRRPLPARASALALHTAMANAPTKWSDDGSANARGNDTKWNPALRRFDLPRSQRNSETANASSISTISTEWTRSECSPWTPRIVPSIRTRR
jgi:hypothetical protein